MPILPRRHIPDGEIDRILKECVAAINGEVTPRRLSSAVCRKWLGGLLPPAARKPTLVNVAKQVSKAGIPVARYEVRPDGTVVVVTGEPTSINANPWDEVLIDAADTKRPS